MIAFIDLSFLLPWLNVLLQLHLLWKIETSFYLFFFLYIILIHPQLQRISAFVSLHNVVHATLLKHQS